MDTIKIANKGNVKMIAHRGLSGIERENTNAAFVAAANRSYFGIETDIHKTVDGNYVLIHDDKTGRVAIDNMVVEESTFDTLRSLVLTDRDGTKSRSDIRIPTLEELTKTHNLALNTCDLVTSTKFFPHATTTNVNNNDAEWQARNVIDGFTQNTGHGTYPLQSWGPKENLSRNDSITIDFGHDVLVSEIVISIRADFPHDGYWDTCRVYFSDGTYQELSIKGTAKAQKFTIAVDGEAKATSYVKFKNFEKADDSQGVWCAWMEVNVNGTEIAPN